MTNLAAAPARTPSLDTDRCFLDVGGAELHVAASGHGPTVVFCPPLPGSAAAVVAALSGLPSVAGSAGGTPTGVRALAVDPPGVGLSDPLDDFSAGLDQAANSLLQALHHLGVEQAVLAGAGVGAVLAIETARRAPALVRALAASDLDDVAGPVRRREDAGVFAPRVDGAHLVETWVWVRDRHLFRAGSNVRRHDVPPDPIQLFEEVLDVFRAGDAQWALRRDAAAYDWPAALSALAMPVHRIQGRAELTQLFSAMPLELNSAELSRAALTADGAGGVARTRRCFARTGQGRVLVRRLGRPSAAPPLVMLHASPGSTVQLLPLMAELANTREVLAIDTIGNGESDKPAGGQLTAVGYAQVVHEAVDAVLGQRAVIDLYGTHTGAVIGAEAARARPDRVRRVVLEGIGVWNAAERADLLAKYAPELTPRWDGTHLLELWSRMRDMTLFWPWYDKSPAAVIDGPPMGVGSLHRWAVEGLKSGTTYHGGYHAAFSYDAAARLPGLLQRVLVCADDSDVLLSHVELAVRALPDSVGAVLPYGLHERGAVLARFLDSPQGEGDSALPGSEAAHVRS